MARVKRNKQIVITDNDGSGTWRIETKGRPSIEEVCDSLLSAYCGAVKMLVDSGTPAQLIKDITMNELEKHIGGKGEDTPCTITH